MPIAADYPFLDIVLTMIIFFTWVVWVWMMILILSDVFRRHDISGWRKAIWVVLLIVLPFIGVLTYLIVQHDGIAQRSIERAEMAERQYDERIRAVASAGGDGVTAEIEKAEQLRARGTITQSEFDELKAKALAAH